MREDLDLDVVDIENVSKNDLIPEDEFVDDDAKLLKALGARTFGDLVNTDFENDFVAQINFIRYQASLNDIQNNFDDFLRIIKIANIAGYTTLNDLLTINERHDQEIINKVRELIENFKDFILSKYEIID